MTENVTHFVVEESNPPNIEHLVPINEIQESNHQKIYLRCSLSEFKKMEPFIETDFIGSDIKEYSLPFDYPPETPLMIWPFLSLPEEFTKIRLENIPLSELAIRRGADVHATDGYVGKVDEFIVNPENGHITHLILRKGHLWGEKEVTIPVSEIDRINENDVFLKMDKKLIASLRAVQLKR
ncbi:MAG: PRC-barrel domain-containing protein [Anaerolineales bacterium]